MGAATENTIDTHNAAADLAGALVAGTGPRDIKQVAAALSNQDPSADLVADALLQVAERQPKLLGPVIGRLARHIDHPSEHVSRTCGLILTELCRTVPAKVAKQIEPLKEAFPRARPAARNGIVHIFIGLCAASVVYQRRLADTLTGALADASLEALAQWAPLILPILKGEPYATAREVVEERLSTLPREEGKALSSTIGVSYRGRG